MSDDSIVELSILKFREFEPDQNDVELNESLNVASIYRYRFNDSLLEKISHQIKEKRDPSMNLQNIVNDDSITETNSRILENVIFKINLRNLDILGILKDKFKSDDFFIWINFISILKNITIIGGYGAGKSTLCSKIYESIKVQLFEDESQFNYEESIWDYPINTSHPQNIPENWKIIRDNRIIFYLWVNDDLRRISNETRGIDYEELYNTDYVKEEKEIQRLLKENSRPYIKIIRIQTNNDHEYEWDLIE